MTSKIVINMGFITNSSFCVYDVPKEVAEDEVIQDLLKLHAVGDGYVSPSLTYRDDCSSIAVTPEMREELAQAFEAVADDEYSYDPDGFRELAEQIREGLKDGLVLVFGDEYESLPSIIADRVKELADKMEKTTSKGLEKLGVGTMEYH